MIKTVIFALAFLAVGATASAQSFFKRLPAPNSKSFSITSDRAGNIVITEPVSTMNAFRPIVNVASYGVPGNTALSGAGISYQHLKFDETSQKWNAVWSINGLAWYSVPLSGNENNRVAYGIAGGLMNNLLLVGVAYDGTKFLGTVGIGISLNN